MSYDVLKILGYAIGLFLLSIFIFFYYTKLRGESLTEKQAIMLCAKIVNDLETPDFKIGAYYFNDNFSLLEAKIELYLIYKNDIKASAECLFNKYYNDNTFTVRSVVITNSDTDLKTFKNIKIKYNNG